MLALNNTHNIEVLLQKSCEVPPPPISPGISIQPIYIIKRIFLFTIRNFFHKSLNFGQYFAYSDLMKTGVYSWFVLSLANTITSKQWHLSDFIQECILHWNSVNFIQQSRPWLKAFLFLMVMRPLGELEEMRLIFDSLSW